MLLLGLHKILLGPVLAHVLCIFLAPSSAFEARFGGKSCISERVNYRHFLWCNDPISASFQRNICDIEKQRAIKSTGFFWTLFTAVTNVPREVECHTDFSLCFLTISNQLESRGLCTGNMPLRQKHMNTVGCKPTEISPFAVPRMKQPHLTQLFGFDILAQLRFKNLLRSQVT